MEGMVSVKHVWYILINYIYTIIVFELAKANYHHYYNSCHSMRGNSMAAMSEEDTKGEELSLSGSPIWNLQAGEDIFPSPPCDQANTFSNAFCHNKFFHKHGRLWK